MKDVLNHISRRTPSRTLVIRATLGFATLVSLILGSGAAHTW